VNTIGPFYYRDILEVTPQEWSEVIDLNLHITFNVTYFAREQICASRGHIVNFAFSGVENLKAWRMSTGYCAAKAGIVILQNRWLQVWHNRICWQYYNDSALKSQIVQEKNKKQGLFPTFFPC